MIVYVLVLSFWSSTAGAPVVIDNLATRADCLRIVGDVQKNTPLRHWSCTPVKKVQP